MLLNQHLLRPVQCVPTSTFSADTIRVLSGIHLHLHSAVVLTPYLQLRALRFHVIDDVTFTRAPESKAPVKYINKFAHTQRHLRREKKIQEHSKFLIFASTLQFPFYVFHSLLFDRTSFIWPLEIHSKRAQIFLVDTLPIIPT